MKILIDIGHPHEVHFFKNFIKELQSEGHKCIITARNRGIIHHLLKTYNIEFIDRGKGSTNLIGKMFYLLKVDRFLLKLSKQVDPDIFIGFGSFYTAQVAKLMRKPSLIFYDTEHSWLIRQTYIPFCSYLFTPCSYLRRHKKKQFCFKGFKELSHLKHKSFTSTEEMKNDLGIQEDQKYIVVRFISKTSFHDVFYKGFSDKDKLKLVYNLNKYAKVYISSEGELPDELKKYVLPSDPERIHDVLNCSSLFIGEGATMASESALMGVPAVYNYMRFGYLQELEREGLLMHSNNVDEIIDYARKVLTNDEIGEKHKFSAGELRRDCIDLTSFMKWVVLNHPNSIKVLKENPDYQLKFK